MHRILQVCSVFVLLFALSPVASAYSVLTHEEIIDLVWDKSIKPLILERFPDATDDDLKEAHAYAYGGAVIQDLGYYPFGSHTFSDLVHYVRTGDFVVNLLHESDNINQYAFALGALAHYASDITGHPAVNVAVGIEFPKLRRRYGNTITYAEDKVAHLEVEFGFDVSQVAKGRYAPQSYHDFIGFEVSKPQLERAFKDTYGLELTDVIKHEDLALGTYRRSVSKIIPQMTKVAVVTREKELKSEIPNYQRKKFLYRLKRADYEKQWGKTYEKPGFGARVLAVVLKIMPKIGPFRGLAYKNPTPQTEDLYFKSVNRHLRLLHATHATGAGKPAQPFGDGSGYRQTHPCRGILSLRRNLRRPLGSGRQAGSQRHQSGAAPGHPFLFLQRESRTGEEKRWQAMGPVAIRSREVEDCIGRSAGR